LKAVEEIKKKEIVWEKAGIWMLRGVRTVFEKGRHLHAWKAGC
jgi:hypothetical protein